jgi:hypothetical protein
MRPPFPTASMFAGPVPWHVMLRIRLAWLLGFRASFSFSAPDWSGPSWFNLNFGTLHFHFPPGWGLSSLCIFPLVVFRRVYEDPSENCWGAALLQVNRRFLVGGVSNSERETLDLLFVHLSHRTPRSAKATETKEK